jgi:hypothetical protein
MAYPNIKKDANGNYIVEGIKEPNFAQEQLNYIDLQQQAETLTGPNADALRKTISTNPNASAGAVSALYKSGTIGSSKLVDTFVEIDKQTKAQRELDQLKETQKAQNENFKNKMFGIPYNIWSGVKSLSRLTTTGLFAPVEAVVNTLGNVVGAAATGQKANVVWEGIDQTHAVQALKQFIAEGKIDTGSGFFINEESGVGFRVRQEKMKLGKIAVLDGEGNKVLDKEGNPLYRPYSPIDPVAYLITGGNLESGTARLIDAIGEIGLMIYADPVSKVNKAKKAADIIRKSEAYAKGRASAEDLKKLTALDAEIAAASDEFIRAKQELEIFDKAPGLNAVATGQKAEFQKTFDEKLLKLTNLDAESQATKKGIDYNALANFLNGASAKPILDEIAQIDDYYKIMEISKKRGKAGFTLEQAKNLANAKTREEVLTALAPYIASGTVTQNILESGTRTSRFLGRIVPGSVARPAQGITGWATKGIRKMPAAEKLYNGLSKNYNTYVPKQGTLVHFDDKDALIDVVKNFARSLKVDEATLRTLVDDIAFNVDPNVSAYKSATKVYDAVFKANAPLFEKAGISTDKLQELTKLFTNKADEQSMYWAQLHKQGANIDMVISGNKKVTLSGPHLESEYLNSMIYFPPATELMKEIQRVGKLSKYAKTPINAIDEFTGNFWKRVILTRPAYIIRNIGEEQIRIMLNGHISFYNNPLAAIGMWQGKNDGPAWKRLVNSFDEYQHNVFGKNIKLATPEEIANETVANGAKSNYQNLMQDMSVGSRGEVDKVSVMRGYNLVYSDHKDWYQGLANEIRILNQSNLAKAVARTLPGKEADTVSYLLYGQGRPAWDRFLNGIQSPEAKAVFDTPEGAMAYLFTGKDSTGRLTSVRARIEQVAGQDGASAQAIIKLIGEGAIETSGYSIKVPKELDDALNSVRNAKEISSGKKKIKDVNEEFADQLKKAFEGTANWNNVAMKVPKEVAVIEKQRRSGLADVTDAFFDFAVKLEKNSSMGPEWRMKYWDTVRDVIYAADADALAQISKVAPKALRPLISSDGKQNIGAKHGFWKEVKSADGTGTMTAEEINTYASRVASQHVKELFYDASKKRLLWHQLRLVAPFGQAWADTISKWGKLAFDNPGELYKVARGLDFLNSPESSALYQVTDAKSFYDPNQGFFFTDPYGQRQFYVPFMSTGMNFMTNLVRGKLSTEGAFGSQGTPQSFNFALGAGILPGFGPGLTIPLSILEGMGIDPLKVLPATPREVAERVLFPYGRPNITTAPGALQTLTTNNISRIASGVFGWEEGYAAAFAPVMNYLASGGDYNLDNLDDQNRLIQDTDKFAKYFTMFRGVFGLTSPVAISPADLTKDKSGDTMLAAALKSDFANLEKKYAGDSHKAYADFLDLYGPEQIFALISSWSGPNGTVTPPSNLMTYQMILQDPGVVDKYPDVYGYFYPNGGFSMELYKWNQRKGKSELLTKQQIIDKATNLRYSAAKDRLLTRSVSEGWSSQYTTAALSNLSDSYNLKGRKVVFDATKEDRTLNQLRQAAQDQRFLDSNAVAGMRDYLYLRDKTLELNGKKPNDSLSAKGFETQRTYLAQQALEIIKRNPDFQKIFYSFFKRELEAQ